MNTATRRVLRGALLVALPLAAVACGGAEASQSSNRPLVSDTHVATRASGGEATQAPTGQPETLATLTAPGTANGASSGTAITTAPPPATRPTGIPGSAIRFTGGDGTSVDHAIVIEGAHGEDDGTASEYQYLAMVYGPRDGGWRMQQQALLSHGGHQFDRLDIVLANGTTASVYFDITGYFGR